MVEMFDFDVAIATIEAQIAALEKARNGLMEAKEALALSGMPSPVGKQKKTLDPDAFVGLSIADATEEYLKVIGRPARSTEDITEALNNGGLEHVGQATVATMLLRVHNTDGPIVRVSRGLWGLASWYPKRPPKIKRSLKDVDNEEAAEVEGETAANEDTFK